jgi:hypothetical protein
MWVLGIEHHLESAVDVYGLIDYERKPLRSVLITQHDDAVASTFDALPVYRSKAGYHLLLPGGTTGPPRAASSRRE